MEAVDELRGRQAHGFVSWKKESLHKRSLNAACGNTEKTTQQEQTGGVFSELLQQRSAFAEPQGQGRASQGEQPRTPPVLSREPEAATQERWPIDRCGEHVLYLALSWESE